MHLIPEPIEEIGSFHFLVKLGQNGLEVPALELDLVEQDLVAAVGLVEQDLVVAVGLVEQDLVAAVDRLEQGPLAAVDQLEQNLVQIEPALLMQAQWELGLAVQVPAGRILEQVLVE